MYTGNNPTALKSQQMIIEALSSLMKEHPFQKISVKAICDRAEVSRQTYYVLFDSKEDIIELHFDRIFSRYEAIASKKKLNTRVVSTWFVHFLMNEYDFVKQLVDNSLTPIMTRCFRNYLYEIEKMIAAAPHPMQKYAMAFVAGALVETAAEYVRDDRGVDDRQLSKIIIDILTGKYFSMPD